MDILFLDYINVFIFYSIPIAHPIALLRTRFFFQTKSKTFSAQTRSPSGFCLHTPNEPVPLNISM